MTTTTKKRVARRKAPPFLPPTADVATIAGRDFVIVPLDDFDEWYEDHLLAVLANERAKDNSRPSRSAEEVFSRQDAKRRKGK